MGRAPRVKWKEHLSRLLFRGQAKRWPRGLHFPACPTRTGEGVSSALARCSLGVVVFTRPAPAGRLSLVAESSHVIGKAVVCLCAGTGWLGRPSPGPRDGPIGCFSRRRWRLKSANDRLWLELCLRLLRLTRESGGGKRGGGERRRARRLSCFWTEPEVAGRGGRSQARAFRGCPRVSRAGGAVRWEPGSLHGFSFLF